jgi:hypothetical protein
LAAEEAGTSSANDETPAKRRKIEDVPSEFPNLKSVRLHKTYLEVGDLFANTKLECLEILIDERQIFDEKDDEDYEMVRSGRNGEYADRIYIKKTRSNSADQLIPLLKLLPNLITLRLGWSKNYQIENSPPLEMFEEDDDYEDFTWKGSFDSCSKIQVGLPKIQNLEIYNFDDNDRQEGFMSFLSSFSESLKSLKFKTCEILTTDFIELLEKLKMLEKIAVHSISSSYGEDRLKIKFVHANLGELDVKFNSKPDSKILKKIFAPLVNIKKLKSNVSSKTIQKLLDQGYFPKLDASWQTTHDKSKKSTDVADDIYDKYADYTDYSKKTIRVKNYRD